MATTRILFFTGKGGVGKTSLACATAVSLSAAGKQVLLVSTDPASNLDEVLGVHLSNAPTAVPGAEGLFALNIDPEAAARAYRERVVGPYRDLLPAAAVASMEEQLSGACTVEIAAFDEFTKLLGDTQATSGYDHIIFDTAPTGHTLRLLHLPAAWTGFMANNTTGTSCLGPLSGLETQKSLYDASLHALTDPATTTLILVSRPSRAALAEASRTSLELAQMGVRNQRLCVNGVFTAQAQNDPSAQALEARGREALATMPPALAALPRTDVPLLPYAPMGLANLAHVFSPIPAPSEAFAVEPAHPSDQSLAALIDDLERQGNGVIMTMGKGGVGKTTIAAAIAVELAHRGHKVHLSTTDPAAHVAATLAGDGESNNAGLVPNLIVSRIDPAAETRDYSTAVVTKASPQLDAAGIALLEEDLRSPCTEEIAVFTAFARTVEEGERGFVVLDTAPTGHTILLLDAAEAYHREVTRTLSSASGEDQPDSVRNLLPRLRNPNFTRVLLVTLPEATPVHEAAHLQADLARAGITPWAWIVNQTFTGQPFTDPTLINRGRREQPFITEVREKFATRLATVPWQPFEPTGPDRLRQLAQA